jgi:hypothetical protein
MGNEERQHLEELLQNYRRRLRHLEKQESYSGPRTPPEVLIEIEDVKKKISEIENNFIIDNSPSVHYQPIPLRNANDTTPPANRTTRRPYWFILTSIAFLIAISTGIALYINAYTAKKNNLVSPTLSASSTTNMPTSNPFLTPSVSISRPIIVSYDESLGLGTEWEYRYTDSLCRTSCTKVLESIGDYRPSGRFVVALIIVGNRGESSKALPEDFFVLQDSQGRLYHSIPEISRAYVQRGINADYNEMDVIPSFELTKHDYSIALVFDVSLDSKELIIMSRNHTEKGWIILE